MTATLAMFSRGKDMCFFAAAHGKGENPRILTCAGQIDMPMIPFLQLCAEKKPALDLLNKALGTAFAARTISTLSSIESIVNGYDPLIVTDISMSVFTQLWKLCYQRLTK